MPTSHGDGIYQSGFHSGTYVSADPSMTSIPAEKDAEVQAAYVQQCSTDAVVAALAAHVEASSRYQQENSP